MEESAMIFKHSGHIDNDSREKAIDIADSCLTEDECWNEVDKLDHATADAIYEVGSFTG
jgi:hypothetical protein